MSIVFISGPLISGFSDCGIQQAQRWSDLNSSRYKHFAERQRAWGLAAPPLMHRQAKPQKILVLVFWLLNPSPALSGFHGDWVTPLTCPTRF